MEFFNPLFPIMTLAHLLNIHLLLPRKRNRVWLNEKETLRIVNNTNEKRKKRTEKQFLQVFKAYLFSLLLLRTRLKEEFIY